MFSLSCDQTSAPMRTDLLYFIVNCDFKDILCEVLLLSLCAKRFTEEINVLVSL